MIESTALFFAVTFVLAVHRATKPGATPRAAIIWLIVAVAAGVLAGMVKVTTLVPWWTGAVILVVARGWRQRFGRAMLIGVAMALIWPLASSLERQVPADEVLLIYGLDLNTEFMYTAHRRAIQSWDDRGAGDPRFERSLALLAQEGGRIGALVACGETRGNAIIGNTARRLAIAERPSYRDVYCDVYFPRDRLPRTDLRFP
jgi:hypothetical protein